MNEYDKYRLRGNRTKLVDNINPVDPVLEFLIGKETITPDMAEDLKAEPTNQDRVARLLNLLEKRGPLAFYHFREALMQQEAYGHLVHSLDNTDITKMPQKKSGKDETDATPFAATSSASASAVPPQTARIHNPHQGNSSSRGATGTTRVNQGQYQSSVTISGNKNFVIMGGKNSKINFH
ncbi:caspase-2-like [Amphiura filiformis]|uniref:caspase-2-like n=1 Tax=Amphiura filiformis TaxID=82378 RepID=UPI003B2213A2